MIPPWYYAYILYNATRILFCLKYLVLILSWLEFKWHNDLETREILILQPAIFPFSQHVIRFHELPADPTQPFLQ